jgi:hypothetical protein
MQVVSKVFPGNIILHMGANNSPFTGGALSLTTIQLQTDI